MALLHLIINIFNQWPYWALWRDGNIDEYYIRIYNREGSLLVEYDATKDVSDFYTLYASQGDHVFLTVSTCNKIYYFSKSEIETGEIHPKLLIGLQPIPVRHDKRRSADAFLLLVIYKSC